MIQHLAVTKPKGKFFGIASIWRFNSAKPSPCPASLLHTSCQTSNVPEHTQSDNSGPSRVQQNWSPICWLGGKINSPALLLPWHLQKIIFTAIFSVTDIIDSSRGKKVSHKNSVANTSQKKSKCDTVQTKLGRFSQSLGNDFTWSLYDSLNSALRGSGLLIYRGPWQELLYFSKPGLQGLALTWLPLPWRSWQ